MNQAVEKDFTEMEKKLKCYVDRGRVAGASDAREEPMITVKPDASLVKPLRRRSDFAGSFMAVDCSTRTIKRANNWGIYLMRPSLPWLGTALLIGGSKRGSAPLSETLILVVTS